MRQKFVNSKVSAEQSVHEIRRRTRKHRYAEDALAQPVKPLPTIDEAADAIAAQVAALLGPDRALSRAAEHAALYHAALQK